ncbi:MAG: NAD(P)/FAD-dependent oxidoreductase [Cellvibrionaceae bacterium]|nr:NAD(P)/FAD-dependent oxidoreductase [Cellvibrionaceae bacterium]
MSVSGLDHFNVCVIGAGVVGLAIAKMLSDKFDSIVVLEREKMIGSGISSRNSEVVHAGIYYPTGSLKAQLCVRGKQLLYEFCQQYKVPHRKIAKLIVASHEQQVEDLIKLKHKAEDNGVLDLQQIDKQGLAEREPEVAGIAALFSPSTGIVDGHSLMLAYQNFAEQNGCLICLNSIFQAAEKHGDDYIVDVVSVGERYKFKCDILINAAGLDAQATARCIEGVGEFVAPPLYYCKGSYFSLTGCSPFKHLIYPMPEANTMGLGVHATLDLSGQVRFGPDTEYQPQPDYSVPEKKRAKFAEAIKRYYPALDPDKLVPAYAGVRPKLQAQGAAVRDFEIHQTQTGLIQLFGIESPGLTASLAIGEYIGNLVSQ